MKTLFIYIILSIMVIPNCYSQRKMTYTILDGDTVMLAKVAAVPIFGSGRKGRKAIEKYERLVRAVKLTYPIAKDAEVRLRKMEADLLAINGSKGQKEYVKNVEQELKQEYTPILKQMSMYQGRVLLKLIDRQTGKTSYELVQELRGKFAAFFWQGIAKIFGANLKTEYDKQTEDALIEGIVQMYEEGLL